MKNENEKRGLFDRLNGNKKAKSSNEIEWINKVDAHSNGNFAVIKWSAEDIKGDKLNNLLNG